MSLWLLITCPKRRCVTIAGIDFCSFFFAGMLLSVSRFDTKMTRKNTFSNFMIWFCHFICYIGGIFFFNQILCLTLFIYLCKHKAVRAPFDWLLSVESSCFWFWEFNNRDFSDRNKVIIFVDNPLTCKHPDFIFLFYPKWLVFQYVCCIICCFVVLWLKFICWKMMLCLCF